MEKEKTFWEGFKEGQKFFGELMAQVINSILLSFVYIVGVGLTHIFALVVRKSFLDKQLDSKKETYWQDLELKTRPLEEYYRQF